MGVINVPPRTATPIPTFPPCRGKESEASQGKAYFDFV